MNKQRTKDKVNRSDLDWNLWILVSDILRIV